MRMSAPVALSVLWLAAAMSAQPPVTPPLHPDDDALLKDFQARVTRYMDLRNQHSSAAPKPTNSPQQLHQAKSEMAVRIQTSRAHAPQGEIFSPQIADYFRRQIAATFAGPRGKRVRSSLRGGEPDAKVPLKINTPYPEHVPLQSTPPTLLLNLPRLPRELEYRIAGRALVLRDVEPNLIVDFIPDALPPPASKQVREK